jgi:FkbM family methyltransferase
LWEYVAQIDEGVFVEAGANDGVQESNTLLLEERKGWSGLLVEPIPELADQCRRNRPGCIIEQAALVSDDFPGDSVTMTYSGRLSVVHGAWGTADDDRAFAEAGTRMQKGIAIYDVEVPAYTLSALLDRHGIAQVDFLSLDVEGYELHALRGLDFARHRPAFLLVEIFDRNHQDVSAYLDRWYERVADLGRGEAEGRWASEVLFRSRALD